MTRSGKEALPWRVHGTRVVRKSVWYHVDGLNVPPAHGLNAHMFEEDMSSGLFPLSGKLRGASHPPFVACNSVIEAAMVADAFAYGSTSSGSSYLELASVISEWARLCAAVILGEGEAVFEVASIVAPDQPTPVGFAVVPIETSSVKWQRTGPVQVVPAGAVGEATSLESGPTVVEAEPRPLDRERTIRVRLRSGPDLKVVGRELRALESDLLPDFAMPGLGRDEGGRVPFEYERFRRVGDVALARVARQTGWCGRGQLNEWQSGYYAMWKFLQRERYRCLIREEIVRTIDRIVRVGGEITGQAIVLQWGGLPRSEDVELAFERLSSGEIAVDDLMGPFLLG